MKLEVKHLAPYLPFKLKAEMVDYKSDYGGKKYDEIIGFHQWDKTGSLWCALTVGGSKPNFQQLKPLLRPLSDITKRINFNGYYLVFLEVIESDYLQDKDSQYLNYLSNYWIEKINSKNISLFQAEMLFKWHFDVFGLIEKGLAVGRMTANGLGLCVVALSKNLKLTTTLDRAITQNPCYVPFLFRI